MNHDLSDWESFRLATLRAKELPPQSNEILLRLYALYKQATTGDVEGDRPGFLDVRGRAKFDAWCGLKGVSRETAAHQYISLVEELENEEASR